MISDKTTLRRLSHCFSMERAAASDWAATLPLAWRTAWISPSFKLLELCSKLKLFELWPSLLLTFQSATNEIPAVCLLEEEVFPFPSSFFFSFCCDTCQWRSKLYTSPKHTFTLTMTRISLLAQGCCTDLASHPDLKKQRNLVRSCSEM